MSLTLSNSWNSRFICTSVPKPGRKPTCALSIMPSKPYRWGLNLWKIAPSMTLDHAGRIAMVLVSVAEGNYESVLLRGMYLATPR